VRPVLVFDGGALPMKAETNRLRRVAREANLKKGMALHQAGNLEGAEMCFRAAVSISWDMMRRFQAFLTKENVEWIVAPYEADAQLAYLSRNGFVDAVVTEDSDLLAFGCTTVLFKLDKHGQCKQVRYADLGSIEKPSLVSFDMDMFRAMCILSGCDYVDSLPGVGLRKVKLFVRSFEKVVEKLQAHELIRRHRTLEGVLAALRADPNKPLPEGYEDRVRLADLTFRHQRVWDVANNCISFLTPMPVVSDAAGHDDYLGPLLSAEEAYGVCSGALNPHTRLPPEAVTPAPTAPVAPAKSASNSLDKYFRPVARAAPPSTPMSNGSLPRPALGPQNRRVSGAYQSTTLALEEFRLQQKQQQQEQQQADRILAPATPEKGSSGRKVLSFFFQSFIVFVSHIKKTKPLLSELRQAREVRDNTPVKIAAISTTRKTVVSRFFEEEDEGDAEALEEATRRSLFESLGAEDEEDEEKDDEKKVEEENEIPIPEPANENGEQSVSRTTSGRISLKPSTSAIVARLLAPSILSSKALKTLSRRKSRGGKKDEDDEEYEAEDGNDDDDANDDEDSKRPTKKLDLGKFAFKQS
jgi:hypothetical protein